MLKEYGTIDAIYEAIENQPEKELKNFFKEDLGIPRSPIANLTKQPTENEQIVGKKAAYLSKELATIVTNVPNYIDVKLDDLFINLNKEKMQLKFKELDFNSLL